MKLLNKLIQVALAFLAGDQTIVCPECRGTGQGVAFYPDDPAICPNCNGTGRVPDEEKQN